MNLGKCCAIYEWPVWGSYTAAPDRMVKVRLGPEADMVDKGGKQTFAVDANGFLNYRKADFRIKLVRGGGSTAPVS